MWQPASVLKRRASRLIAIGFLMTVSLSGLSACRTAPNVAAYVGDERVTVSELDAAIDQRLEDEDIAAYADGQGAAYTRAVLDRLVQREIYAAAAERYDVEVSDDQVRARINGAVADAGADLEEEYAKAAAQGFSRADVFEDVREQLIAIGIAEAAGKAEALSEASLRAAYEQEAENPSTIQLGLVAVPDQATADAVLAQLTAAPQTYSSVAAQHPGQNTLPELQEVSVDQIPAELSQATTTAPGTGFTVPVPELNAVVVGFVGPAPTFEEARAGLARQASQQVQQEGVALVKDVRDDLGVHKNPRYEGDDGKGVVEILGGDDEADAAE
jgi:peptidyl-prolyl cis-trans isomerase SurA